MGNEIFRLLVLVPHRDVRLTLRKWSAELFAAGIEGAWSFPWVAPLALLRRFLTAKELKSLAVDMRQDYYSPSSPGALSATASLREKSRTNFALFGLNLNLKLPDVFFEPIRDAIEYTVSPTLIGAALVHGKLPDGLPNAALAAPPPLVFSHAAAIANMEYRFLAADGAAKTACGGNNGYLCEWKIGALHWLPKKR